jgi:nucleoside-diphosphate-sugar epimerase
MSDLSALIVGCGDVGGRLGQLLLEENWQVSGLRRSVGELPEGIRPIRADLSEAACPDAWPKKSPDYVVYCVAASQHDEAGYQAAYVDGLRNVLRWLEEKGQQPRRLLFVSSSSVYGQHGGEWSMKALLPSLQAIRGASCSRRNGWPWTVASRVPGSA